jgi:DNA-binding SARP family transcriptional activator
MAREPAHPVRAGKFRCFCRWCQMWRFTRLAACRGGLLLALSGWIFFVDSAAGVGCATVEFRVLDQVKAFDDAGTAIVLEPKLQVLLAMLLINQGAQVARTKLKAWLWDDKFRAETTFDGYVTDLRRALVSAFGDRVTLQPDGVGYLRLTVADPMCVDYRRFRARVAAAKAADSDEKAVEELGAAIEEFRGEPLGVLSGSELRNIRTDLDRQHRDACHDRAGRMIGLGWHADALTELNRYRTRWAQDEELSSRTSTPPTRPPLSCTRA